MKKDVSAHHVAGWLTLVGAFAFCFLHPANAMGAFPLILGALGCFATGSIGGRMGS